MAMLTKDQVRQIIARAPAGTSPEGVVAALRETHQLEGYEAPDVPRGASVAPQAMMSATNNPAASRMAGMGARVVKALPDIAGAAGGMAGKLAGPAERIVSPVLAGAGGAVGEGARQLASGETMSLQRIGQSAATQGAYEVAGGAIAKGANAVARPIMRRALGVGKTILSSFPDAVEVALEKGISVSKGGAAKAVGLREKSSQALTDLLLDAKATGKTFDTVDVTKHVRALLGSKVLPEKDKDRIMGQLLDFLKDKGTRVDPVLLKEVKQFYQNRASAVYKAGQKGIPTLAQENRALFSKAVASGAREQLETIPGVAAREAETQSLIGAQRAVDDAVMRPPQAFDLSKPGTFPVANNPQVMSRVALLLNSPKFQAALRQSPRAAGALLMQLMHADDAGARHQEVAKARSGGR